MPLSNKRIQGFLEMTDSRVTAKNMQNECRISGSTESKKAHTHTHTHTHTHIPMRACQKNIGANRKSSKWPKLEQLRKN